MREISISTIEFLKNHKFKILATTISFLIFLFTNLGNEFQLIITDYFLSSKVELIIKDDRVVRFGRLRITTLENKPIVAIDNLRNNELIKIKSGNYILKIIYIDIDDKEKVIQEKNFEIGRNSFKEIIVNQKIPLETEVRIILPKKRFIPKEKFQFKIKSSFDGYYWLFSPDNYGNANLLILSDQYKDNRIIAYENYNFKKIFETQDHPGKEKIVCIVTENNDKLFALSCLKKIFPEIQIKIAVQTANGKNWGWDFEPIEIIEQMIK